MVSKGMDVLVEYKLRVAEITFSPQYRFLHKPALITPTQNRYDAIVQLCTTTMGQLHADPNNESATCMLISAQFLEIELGFEVGIFTNIGCKLALTFAYY